MKYCPHCHPDWWRGSAGDTCPNCDRPFVQAAGSQTDPCRVKVRFIFAWYDLWIGAFWDSARRKLYILPLPCVGVVVEFRKPENAEVKQ